MLRKLLIYTLVVMLVLPAVAWANGTELTVMEKTLAVEKVIYGSEQTGSLVERVGRLEKDVYGAEAKDALVTKLDRLYKYMKDNSTVPSFLIKLNGVEWTLTHNVTALPGKARLESIEKTVLGSTPQGSLDDRLGRLMKFSYPNGQIEVSGTTLNKDTLIKIQLITPLDTKTSRPGDIVRFQAADDVYSGGILVIAKGAGGSGKVAKVEQAKNFGRDAKLEVTFDSIEAVDGSLVETLLGEKAKEETKSTAKAAGAAVAGIAILGPIGIIGSAFVQGQDISIPAGTELFIQTKADTDLYGIRVK